MFLSSAIHSLLNLNAVSPQIKLNGTGGKLQQCSRTTSTNAVAKGTTFTQRPKGNTVCTCRLFYILDSCSVFQQEALSRMPQHQDIIRFSKRQKTEAQKKAISDLRHHVCKTTKPRESVRLQKTWKKHIMTQSDDCGEANIGALYNYEGMASLKNPGLSPISPTTFKHFMFQPHRYIFKQKPETLTQIPSVSSSSSHWQEFVHLFVHIQQKRTGGTLLVLNQIVTKKPNLIHYFHQSLILIIKKMNSVELMVQ